MKSNHVAATIAYAATVLAAGAAFAAGPTNAEYFPFHDASSMKVIDTASTAVKSTSESTGERNSASTGTTRTMGAPSQGSEYDGSREIQMYLKAGG